MAIRKSLEGVEGVKKAKVSFKEKKAWVVVDEKVRDEALEEAVSRAGGYKGKVVERTELE